MTTNRNPSSVFPDMPRDYSVSDIKRTGELTPAWKLFFEQMVLSLQTNFSNEGISLPNLNDTQINNIQAVYTPFVGAPLPPGVPNITGRMVFENDPSVGIGGTFVPKVFIIRTNNAPPFNIIDARWWTFTIF